jgi:hypothetical protein
MPLLEDRSSSEIELMKQWAEVRQYVEKYFEQKPDIQTCLFLIGMNELGEVREFSKEEKQDIMHVGMCTLLDGEYYRFIQKDEDGWPHFEELEPLPALFIKSQEQLLKSKIVNYFFSKVL